PLPDAAAPSGSDAPAGAAADTAPAPGEGTTVQAAQVEGGASVATVTIQMKDGGRSTMVLPPVKKPDPAMKAHAARVMRCVQSLDWDFSAGGTLDFIPAGQQGPGYAARVNSFNWSDFYRTNRGEELFHEVRELLRREYEYVLIDSRTGVSDTSGICTVQMPDTVVVCFTLNNQGIEGAAGIARSVVEQRRERPVDVFPVPMRVENAEKEKLESRKAFAQRQFERIHFALPRGVSRADYWKNVLFPYVPFYAYEEILATFGDRQEDATSLIAPALRLAAYVSGEEKIQFTPPAEELRAEILARYARNSALPVELTSPRRAREAEEIYSALTHEEQEAAYRVFTRLVQLAEPGEGADTWVQVPLAALDDTERRVARRFQGSALEVKPRESGGETVQTADENLLGAWKRLSLWTVQDRQFLLWRRRLAANLSEWIQSERDASGLLTGARLSAASRWLSDRRDQLTAREVEFIERSINRYEHRKRRLLLQRIAGGAGLAVLLVIGVLSYTRARAAESRSRVAQAQYQKSLDSLRVAGLVRSGSDNAQVGNYGRAIQDFQAAIALDSANPQAFFGLGNASYQSGDLVTSVSALSQAVQANPRYWSAYDVRSQAYLETGDTARAIADLQQVVQLAPDSVKPDRLARLQRISAGRVPVDSRVTINIRYRSR
ncbi:MAG TPA: tetratricopeptide repeat protein, partial [Longimicrobium sp.]|nr:tetratricopeptide repeat protein [Longimicrobium sp.]